MSILIIMGACSLIAGPCEAVAARRNRRKVKPYRKPDPPKRHKKSPPAFHNRELSRLYLF